MKKTVKKLRINIESIKVLSGEKLAEVHGGMTGTGCVGCSGTVCASCTQTLWHSNCNTCVGSVCICVQTQAC